MSTQTTSLELLSINTIRTLSMDAVQAANCGHPGTPMALAPVAYTLWNHQLQYDPADPTWPVRDRFVLSCGHAMRGSLPERPGSGPHSPSRPRCPQGGHHPAQDSPASLSTLSILPRKTDTNPGRGV